MRVLRDQGCGLCGPVGTSGHEPPEQRSQDLRTSANARSPEGVRVLLGQLTLQHKTGLESAQALFHRLPGVIDRQ